MSLDLSDNKNKLKQDFDDVFHKGQLETLNNYESFKGEASGAAIAINDVSSIEHNAGVQLSSKNLFDISKCTMYDLYSTFTDNGTSITFDYSTKTNDYFPFYCWVDVVPNTDYKLSIENRVSIAYAYVYTDKLFGNLVKQVSIVSEYFNSGDNTRLLIGFYSLKSRRDTTTTTETVSNIQLEIGTTATEYTPYISDLSTVEVSRCGKNLCSDNFADYFTNTTTSYAYYYIGNTAFIMSIQDKDTSVDASGCYFGLVTSQEKGMEVKWGISNGNLTVGAMDNISRQSSSVGILCPYVAIYPKNEATFNKIMQRWDIQVELGTTPTNATPYEPYIEPTTYTAKADGTVEGVTSIAPNMTLLTNNNGVIINCNYLKDIDKYIDNLTTNVALTGGE